jgi:hypothetical protein
MENFDDFEKKSYQEGVEIKYGFSDYFSYFAKMFLFFLKIASVMAQEIFQKIFFGTKVKNIHGQLALVTGKSFASSSPPQKKFKNKKKCLFRWSKRSGTCNIIPFSTRRLQCDNS